MQTGLVWFTKILTDPFHDIMLYHKAPLYLLRGEMIEPAHTPERALAPLAASPARRRERSRQTNGAASISRSTRRLIDLLVSAGARPPAAVALHGARGGHEAVGDRVEVGARCS